jgi:hypothetical protein
VTWPIFYNVPSANAFRRPAVGRSVDSDHSTGLQRAYVQSRGTNGYGLYLLKGKPVFTYNLLGIERFRWEAAQALGPGKHTVIFDFKYDGPGLAKGGTGVLKVDGAEVATRNIPRTIAFTMPFDETFDVGVDTRTGVNDADYQPPFRFTGTIDKLTFKHGPEQFTAVDHQKAAEAKAIALTAFDLRELIDERPPAAIQVVHDRLTLRVEAKAGFALPIRADSEIGNELAVMR